MKRMLSLLCVLCLIFCLAAGCGAQSPAESAAAGSEALQSASVQEETPEAEAGTEEAAPVQEADTEEAEEAEEMPSAEETAAEELAEEGYVSPYTVEYPIPGEHTLSMIQCMRNHAAAVLGDGDFSDQYVYPELAKRTGVEIEFEMIAETAFTERLNLIIVAQDYPDIFGQGIGTYDSNPMKAIEDEVVIDLDPLLEENAPDYYTLLQNNKDFHDSVYNSDGTICKITGCNIGIQSQGLFIRGDWLDALGLEIPETIDEMTEVLREFHKAYNTSMTLMVNADLDDGLAGAFDHSNIGFTRQMLGFQQTAPNSHELVCATCTDGYFEHMTLLRQYFAEGLINEDFANISKENGNFESSYYSGVCGIWQEGCEIADDSYRENAEDPNWVAIPMMTPVYNGQATHMSGFSETQTGMMSLYISTDCADPEVALQFMNYGFTEEGMDLIAFGIEGETFTRDADGKVQYTELLTEFPDGVRAAEWLYLVSSWMPTRQQLAAVNMKYSDKAVAAWQMWTEAAKAADDSMAIPMMLSLDTDEMTTVFQYNGDLATHFAEYTGRYIMGTIDEDEFRQAIADGDKIGLQEVTEAYQSAYDRYLLDHPDA